MKHGATIIAFVEDPDGYRIELIQKKVSAEGVVKRLGRSALSRVAGGADAVRAVTERVAPPGRVSDCAKRRPAARRN